jgi:hypothetical protein
MFVAYRHLNEEEATGMSGFGAVASYMAEHGVTTSQKQWAVLVNDQGIYNRHHGHDIEVDAEDGGVILIAKDKSTLVRGLEYMDTRMSGDGPLVSLSGTYASMHGGTLRRTLATPLRHPLAVLSIAKHNLGVHLSPKKRMTKSRYLAGYSWEAGRLLQRAHLADRGHYCIVALRSCLENTSTFGTYASYGKTTVSALELADTIRHS